MAAKSRIVGAGTPRFNPYETTKDKRFWVDYDSGERIIYHAPDRSQAVTYASLILGQLGYAGFVNVATMSTIDMLPHAPERNTSLWPPAPLSITLVTTSGTPHEKS